MRFNKFLGQNFLKSKKIAREIIEAADLSFDDIVLEVGPGTGFLTEELVNFFSKVVGGDSLLGWQIIAVEKDKRLVGYLRKKFYGIDNLKIIEGDILKFQIPNPKIQVLKNPKNLNYKIVANIPYYITSHFLKRFLQTEYQPSRMVLMVQKEVAKRIVARDKKESLLSISVKVYGNPKIIRLVPKSYFFPQPKVDSAILLIDNISKDFFKKSGIEEKKFFELVKRGFSKKRKFLKNNLGLKDDTCFLKCGILKRARPENLSPENWKCLYKNIYK